MKKVKRRALTSLTLAEGSRKEVRERRNLSEPPSEGGGGGGVGGGARKVLRATMKREYDRGEEPVVIC